MCSYTAPCTFFPQSLNTLKAIPPALWIHTTVAGHYKERTVETILKPIKLAAVPMEVVRVNCHENYLNQGALVPKHNVLHLSHQFLYLIILFSYNLFRMNPK